MGGILTDKRIAVAAIVIVIIVVVAGILVGLNLNNGSDTGTAPPEVVQNASDWPLPNKDYNNSRATTDSTITSQNVMNLGLSWSYSIQAQGAFGTASSNPIIIGDSVLFQDIDGNTVCLNFNTGAVKWSKWYNNTAIEGPNGPGVGYGKVFIAKDPYNVTALDINTGEELWSTRLSNVSTTGIDIQPVVYDGLVYTATVPGTGDVFYAAGGIGIIYALDQATGKIVWTFETVPQDLWGHPEVNSGGGCWYAPAIDTNTGMMYWAIANPAPFAGTEGWPNGTSFAGSALYSNCMVELDHKTGELIWYSQAVAHDIFDHDLQISPILTTGYIAGVDQDIVIGAGKMGTVYAFNRENGNILWEVPVGIHYNDLLDQLDGPTWVSPGVLGGVETPMAYSDGVVYVPVVDLPLRYIPTGIDISTFSLAAGKGQLVAIDVNLGKILWNKTYDTLNVGGATVVNDVVFTATYDGVIYAYEKKTGELLFQYKAPSGINAWPAVKGDTIIWPCGTGGTPSVIALKLGSTPHIEITDPVDGTTLVGPDISINTHVTNINLVNKLGQANVPGEAHIVYYLDVTPPTTAGESALTAEGTYYATDSTEYIWHGLSTGSHTLSVQLVNNDQTPLEPAVTATVNIAVNEPSPTLSIMSPTDGSTLSGPDIPVYAMTSNIDLVDKIGQANVDGEGHLIYYLDVTPPTASGQPATTANGTYYETAATSYTWTNVSNGTHTLSVQLVNNDGTPLATPLTASVSVTVGGGGGGQGSSTVIYLKAQNIAFNLTTMSVPAGATITVYFDNLDSGVPHNFAVYDTSAANVVIFQGQIITGVSSITYTFTAPTTPGTYFFRCDVHPTLMNGSFIVT